jgi:thymidylate synthase
LYHNHFEQARLQLTREPYAAPRMVIEPSRKDIFAFEYGDFVLKDYVAHPTIKAPIAV